jgi:MFS family permease
MATRLKDLVKIDSPYYKWTIVGLLFVSGFLNLEDRVVVFSVVPLIRDELHVTAVQLGALMTWFLWVYAAVSPLSGYFGDRLSRRLVILNSVFAWSLVTIWAGAITSIEQLYATRILLGITESFYLPAALAMIGDWHPRSTRGKAVSVLILGANLGPILGGTFAGWVGENHGWRAVMYVLGGIGVVHTFLLLKFLKNAPPGTVESMATADTGERPRFFDVVKTLVRIPSLLCIGLVSGLNAVAIWGMNTWFPVYLFDHFHKKLTESAFLGNTVLMAPMMVGTALGGFLSDKLGAKTPRYRFLLFLTFMALAAPWPLLFSWGTSLSVALISVALFGLCRSLGECNWHPVMYELVSPRMRSTATGMANSFNCLMGGIGALVGGYYQKTLGLQGLFGMVSGLVLISVTAMTITYFVFLPRDLKRAAGERTADAGQLAPELAH